jgi:hypothetical protein
MKFGDRCTDLITTGHDSDWHTSPRDFFAFLCFLWPFSFSSEKNWPQKTQKHKKGKRADAIRGG